MRRIRTLPLFLTLAIVLLPCAAWSGEHDAPGHDDAAQGVGHGKRVVVTLGHYTDDLHAALMALKLGNAMLAEGAEVTLFLNLEAVRLVDRRNPQDLTWGHSKPIGTYYESFVSHGGHVLVCPHCSAVAGLTDDRLRDGARIADGSEVTRAILTADVVLDY